MSHLSAEQLDNGTITSGQISHVGQLFFDQDLIDLVETASPYVDNTQEQVGRLLVRTVEHNADTSLTDAQRERRHHGAGVGD